LTVQIVDRMLRNTGLTGGDVGLGTEQLSLKMLGGGAQSTQFLFADRGSLVGGQQFSPQFGNGVLESLLDTLGVRCVALSRITSVVEFRGLRTKQCDLLRQGMRLIARGMCLMQTLLEQRARFLMMFDLTLKSLNHGGVRRDLIAKSIVLLHQAVERSLQLIRTMLRSGHLLLKRICLRG